MYVKKCLLLVVTTLWLANCVNADKPNLSPERLRAIATHVVTGQVLAVYERIESSPNYTTTKYLAEIRVNDCEKGDGVEKDELVYVRYWRQKWIGKGSPPPGTSGHRGIPKEGDHIRVYLARNSSDAFSLKNDDGGFNVIGANGFESP